VEEKTLGNCLMYSSLCGKESINWLFDIFLPNVCFLLWTPSLMALLNICNVLLSKNGHLSRLLQHSYLQPLCIDLHCELPKVIHILLEIVAYGIYILVKLSFFISKHQLFLTLVVLYSLHIYNNDCNASKIPILDIIFEFLDGINLKKWRNQFKLEIKIWQHNGCRFNDCDNVHVTFIKTLLGFWFYAKKILYEMHAFCIWGDFTLKVIVVKIAMSSQSQCKYVYLESSMVLFAIRSKVPYLLKTFPSNITSLISKSKSFTTKTNLPSLITTVDIVPKKSSRTY